MRPVLKLVLLAILASLAVACAGTWSLDIQTRPGRIITGILLFDVTMKAFVVFLLLLERRDSQDFLRGAHDLLTWAKDARNSAEHRAATVVTKAVTDLRHEAARIAEAAETVKSVAGADSPIPKTPAAARGEVQ